MTRRAKASSAGSTSSRATGLGSRIRGAFATRGASSGVDGSGAPSGSHVVDLHYRASLIAASLLVAALALLAFASAAQAGKVVDRIVSGTTSTGTTGGLFSSPRGIAVNHANVNDGNGTEGWIYVVDDNNHRIQAFNADDEFQFAIGRDVIKAGAVSDTDLGDVFEKCTTASDCKAGSFGTTSDGPAGEFDNPQGIAIDQASGDFYVRDRDNRRVQQFEADGTFVRMWGHDVIVATGPPPNSNGTGFEICDVTNGNDPADCKVGTTGALGGQFATSSSTGGGIAVVPAGAPNAGNVIVADPGNRRVQEFEADGTWVRAWGWDVIQPGGTGEQLGPPNDERQTVSWSGSGIFTFQGGSFTLTFEGQTTDPIAWDATAAEVDTALEELSTIGAGDVVVSGGPGGVNGASFTIDFTGALGAADVPQMTGNGAALETQFGAGFVTVSTGTPIPGGPTAAFESCTVIAECKAGASSNPADQDGAFSANHPTFIAVDAGGTTYASDSAASNRVQRFDTTEAAAPDLLQSSIPVTSLTGTSNTGTTDLAVDPSGNLFVGRSASIGVLEIGDPGGTPTDADRHYQGASLTPNGLALDGVGDDLYLTTSHRVFAADDDGAPPPAVTINTPANLEAHSATLTGTVNPGGALAVSYRFEYSKNGVTWTNVAPLVDIGGGTTPIVVDDDIAGLEANTFYRARLVTLKGFGNPEVVSNEAVFLTDGVAPEVETFHPKARSETGATLAGQVNANNLSTAYHFEYGTTSEYGSQAPIPSGSASGGVDELILTDVGDLDPDTAYHYRLCATNAEGTACGDDVGFSTRATLPAEGERAYEMVTPPFKAIRTTVNFGGAERNSSNPGVPSIDGNSMLWGTVFFPLTDDVRAPANSDKRLMVRTPEGWTWTTQNTRPFTTRYAGEETGRNATFAKAHTSASTADLRTQAWTLTGCAELLPSSGPQNNLNYIRRDGTGVAGFSPFTTDSRQAGNFCETKGTEAAVLNDSGTAMVRWAQYWGVGEDPGTLGDDDPSDEQVISGKANVYRMKSATPDGLPTAAKELVNECTGTGGDATILPTRTGTGTSSDEIGSQACEEQGPAPAATGTGVRTSGSSTLTSVTADTGSFAVGQIVSGLGIPRGTRITAVGPTTLTLSANASCGGGVGEASSVTAGSPILKGVWMKDCGQFMVGQTITGTGIPGGTTITDISGPLGNTLTLSADATANGSFVVVAATAPAVTQLTANAQHVTSLAGAKGGGLQGNRLGTMSNDGNRVFFLSPDFGNSSTPSPAGCSSATGVNTSCPPQLFVRQYDSSGSPTVRWISRAQGVGTQQIGLLGAAIFQGASKDGRYVYFQTRSPLLADDPNGGSSITTGTASTSSWDLYRYALPSSLDSDPASGTLTRITGGPTGTADPDSNVANGRGASLRYLSDDGKRAYFVTTSPIAGADNPPGGGATAPGGAVNNSTTRNLYLFDDTGVTPKWQFIARIPFSDEFGSTDGAGLDSCASYTPQVGDHLTSIRLNRSAGAGNCFRGTPDGSNVIFATTGRLTADDLDSASDIYLYDEGVNELTRVSAGLPDADPYGCVVSSSSSSGLQTHGLCNADLGINSAGGSEFGLPAGGFETARGWAGGRSYNIGVDADGVVSVFFESQSRLVPEDTNGDHMDVYQWRNGVLSLVSRGNTSDDSYYSGNGADGRDVFMFTSDRIDPREIDDYDYDIYNARIGGGFPYTPPPTPCDVIAFECESEAISGPAARGSATAGFSGAGNVRAAAARCGKAQVRRGKRCVAKRALARRACAKRKGKAKQRCVRKQVRRLNRANANRRNSR